LYSSITMASPHGHRTCPLNCRISS
jgi:hypothetical protein